MKKQAFFIKIFLLVSLTAVFILNAYGQSGSKTYTLTGVIKDADTGQPVSFAQVALFVPGDDQPAVFTDSNEQGRFRLNAPEGVYDLRFFLIGYDRKEISGIEIRQNLDLEEVEMEIENQDLEEVLVHAVKVPMRADVEGITIFPEQNLSNLGGTLLDILRNTPSISVSEDGSVSLRGSGGTNILINGRNSSLTQNLDQLPASAVEQIKVINNPNARFDAEAEGGVIDIILKRGEDMGTNGSAEFTYGTRGRMNTGARINHRNLKYNVYGGYSYRLWKSRGERRSVREIFDDEEVLRQQTGSIGENAGHTFNYGGDYFFGKNILSYEGVVGLSDDSQTNTLYSELTDKNTDDLVLEYVRRNSEGESDDGMDNALIYERTFDDPDREFRVTASHSFRRQYKTQHIDIFRDASEELPENLNGQERAFTDERRHIS